MMKLIKEIFSSENLRRSMISISFLNPNLTAQDYLRLTEVFRNENSDNINKEIQVNKAA